MSGKTAGSKKALGRARDGQLRAKPRSLLYRMPPRAQLGLAILVVILLGGVLVPLVSPYDPAQQNLAEALKGFSFAHPFGTDPLGRDVLVRVAVGARWTVGITLAATCIGAIVGISLGVLAAYYGRWIEVLIMRAVDVMLTFPGVLIAFVVIAILGPGTVSLIFAASIYSAPIFARLAFGTTKSVKARQFVEAARLRGASDLRVMSQHILPNIFSEMVILWTLRLGVTALLVSSLSFLGLGVQPPTPEWGALLSQGREYMRIEPSLTIIPGMAISLFIIAINLLGDGLRDAIDPRYRVK